MTAFPARSKITFDEHEQICHWCHESAAGSPYRSPMIGTPGGRWRVCGPDCPKRPENVMVMSVPLR